jgi:hypothetical protein
MKLQRQLLVIALLLSAQVSANAGGVAVEARREHLRFLRTHPSHRMNLSPLDRAYLDSLKILGETNSCRDFFGGDTAQIVLTELVIHLQETRMNDSSIGVRMSGRFTMFPNSDNRPAYRLFDHVELNTAGPFLKAQVFPADPFVPRFGNFPPNTRAIRAFILFHELAHLILNRDGTWLIPDDGDRPELSRANNRKIEARCGEQIRVL